ncbi:hypothetical protein BTM318_09720 [Helicobacter pylori]
MRTSYARYKCMVVLYYKLVAFIPNTKDVWDFCLGGLNKFVIKILKTKYREIIQYFSMDIELFKIAKINHKSNINKAL